MTGSCGANPFTHSGSTPLIAQKQGSTSFTTIKGGMAMAIKHTNASLGDLWMEVERYTNASELQRSHAKELLLTYQAHDVSEMLGL